MPIVIEQLEIEIIPEAQTETREEPASGTPADSRRCLESKALQQERQRRLEMD